MEATGREKIVELMVERMGVSADVARRSLDLSEAAFKRAWDEATTFIQLENDDDIKIVAMYMLLGAMAGAVKEKQDFAALGVKLVAARARLNAG